MISKEFLELEYVARRRPMQDIANQLGISEASVRYWLKKHRLGESATGGRYRSKDFHGHVIGKLTIKDRLPRREGDRGIIWNCVCECGKESSVTAEYLTRSGERASCDDCWDNPHWKGFGEISGAYFNSLKYAAESRGLVFEVKIEFLWKLFELQGGRCALTGRTIQLSRNRKRNEQTASVDRIDSGLGYVEGNVRWVHKHINEIKLNFSDSEFIQICREVVCHDRKNRRNGAVMRKGVAQTV